MDRGNSPMGEKASSGRSPARVSRRGFLGTGTAVAVAVSTAAAQGAGEKKPNAAAEKDAAERKGRVVRIAAVQLADAAEGKTADEIKAFHRRNIERTAREAAGRGADIVCWHETAVTYGVKAAGDDRRVWEEATEGPTTRWACDLARQLRVHFALPMHAFHQGARRNAVVFIERAGRVLGVYAKVHLTYGERQDGLVAGDSFPVFQYDFGKVGAVVCHDLSFPEAVRCLALRGAEVVFWPTHWSGWGDLLNYAVIKSRAIDNGLWLVHVGLAPPPGRCWRPGLNMARSGVIDPYGEHISNAGFLEGISIAEVDLDKPRVAHSFSAGGEHNFRAWMLADRRPETYGAITDPTLRPAPPPAKLDKG